MTGINWLTRESDFRAVERDVSAKADSLHTVSPPSLAGQFVNTKEYNMSSEMSITELIEKLRKYEAIVASGEIGSGTRNDVAELLGRAANEIDAKESKIAMLKVEACGAYYSDQQLRDELAAKDAEIAQLKACRNGDCNRLRLGVEPCPGCHIQTNINKIESLKSLVKELTDALQNHFRCSGDCEGCMRSSGKRGRC